jgi:hypothetical protein
MSLGSFLATAGAGVTSFDEAKQAARLDRQNQLAIEAQNREARKMKELEAEASNLIGQQIVPGLTPPGGVMPTAPAATSAGVQLPATGLPVLRTTPAAVAPVVKPAAVVKAAATPPVPPAVKPAAVVKAAAVAAPKTGDRLGEGVAGFRRIDPNASDVTQGRIRTQNEATLNNRLSGLVIEANVPGSTFRKPFATQTEKRQMEAGDTAAQWYKSPAANKYFRANPEMLASAEANPVAFYKEVTKAKVAPAAKAAARAPAAGVQTPATKKAQQQAVTEQVTTQVNQEAPVASVSAPTPEAQAQASQNPVEWYLGNPQAISPEMQNAMTKREQLARLAMIYARARSPADSAKFFELKGVIDQIDNNMAVMQGTQGILEFGSLNDPRRLNAIMTHYMGVPVAVQPRDDGKFNIVRLDTGDKTTTIARDLSRDDVVGRARAMFDTAWRTSREAAIAAQSAKIFDYNLDISKEQFKGNIKSSQDAANQLATSIRTLAVTEMQGNTQRALESMKQRGVDVRVMGEGAIITDKATGQAFYYNPTGQTVTIGDKEVTRYGAVPVEGMGGAGLTTPGTFQP